MQNVAHLRTAADKNDGHAAGVTALDELFKGVRAGGVEPEDAGKMQNQHARRGFLHAVKTALQLVNGPEEERALDEVDGKAGRQTVRQGAQERICGRHLMYAGMRGLVDEEAQRKDDAKQNGLRQIEGQRGKEGGNKNNTVRAGGHKTEPNIRGLEGLHGNEHEHAAKSGHGHMGNERRKHIEQRQAQEAGEYGGHAGTRAKGDHGGAAGEGAAAGQAGGKARGDIAEALGDEFAAAVENVVAHARKLLADGQRLHAAEDGEGQRRGEEIPHKVEIKGRRQGQRRHNVGNIGNQNQNNRHDGGEQAPGIDGQLRQPRGGIGDLEEKAA